MRERAERKHRGSSPSTFGIRQSIWLEGAFEVGSFGSGGCARDGPIVSAFGAEDPLVEGDEVAVPGERGGDSVHPVDDVHVDVGEVVIEGGVETEAGGFGGQAGHGSDVGEAGGERELGKFSTDEQCPTSKDIKR